MEPLWASASSPNITTCPTCQTARTAEFQIMPALLTWLGDDSEDGLDFGTIVVYTCPKSCKTSSIWTEETCWIQMFSQDGVNIGQR